MSLGLPIKAARTPLERVLEQRVAVLERALRLARRVIHTDKQMTTDAERVIDNALEVGARRK